MTKRARDPDRWAHDPDRTYCEDCEREFGQTKSYRRHMYEYHRDVIGMDDVLRRDKSKKSAYKTSASKTSASKPSSDQKRTAPQPSQPAASRPPPAVTVRQVIAATRSAAPQSSAPSAPPSGLSAPPALLARDTPAPGPRPVPAAADAYRLPPGEVDYEVHGPEHRAALAQLAVIFGLDTPERSVSLDNDALGELTAEMLNDRMQTCIANEREFFGARATISGARGELGRLMDELEGRLQGIMWQNRANMGLYSLELERRRNQPPAAEGPAN